MNDNRPPPPFSLPEDNGDDGNTFITSDHPSFDACLKRSFDGFVHEPASSVPRKFHRRFREALESLYTDGVFRYDYTQPMGYNTPLARTRVRRCLVGQPGITYRYLGVRMFAHPWSGSRATKAAKKIRKLSKKLEKRAKAAGAPSGSCSFNLTLVNRMDPSDEVNGGGAKPEKVFGMGQCSVSWHADSSLEDFSAISVYVAQQHAQNELLEQKPSPPEPHPWRVALRLVRDVEGPSMREALNNKKHGGGGKAKSDDTTTPAVVIPIHDGDIYHMVGNFNHHHQHAVLQGKGCVRYSSTHRVGVEEGHMVQSVQARAERALQSGKEDTIKQWQEEQACLAELEFEWLRQWYGQGIEHSKQLGPWWNERIASLEELWVKLEQRTVARLEQLRKESMSGAAANNTTSGKLLEQTVVLHGALTKRRRLRQSWAAREVDPLIRTNCPPIPCLFKGPNPPTGTLPEDLTRAIAEVEGLLTSLSQQRKKAKPCFHFKKFGNCSKGSDCPFSHEESMNLVIAYKKPVANNGNSHLVSNNAEAAREWPFQDVDFGDHYETPKVAYSDVKPLLKKHTKSLGTSASKLGIYDPYYCRGRVVSLLTELGFSSVIHEKRDFYADIAAGKIPEHDVLLTNPPYSGDHKERLFRYLLDRQKRSAGDRDAPFLLLLPAWSASKLAWRQFLWCLAEMKKGRTDVTLEDAARGERAQRVGAFSDRLEEQAGCFFVCPPERYRFVAAVESCDEAPFDGIWFCGGWRDAGKALKAISKANTKRAAKQKRTTTICTCLAELRSNKLLPAAEDVRAALTEEDAARRKRALQELDEARRSDPGWAERKRRKAAESRDRSKVSIGNDALAEETRKRVLATPKACRHFFGLSGSGGCTRGDNCRFLHALPS